MKVFWRKYGKKTVTAAVWLLVWQLVAELVGNRILLVGPFQTLQALGERALKGSFWLTLGCSLLRIGSGFLAGLTFGLLLAVGSSRFSLLEELLKPVMSLLKAVPVASFVVLFLIWWRSDVLAAAITFCIVLPNIYVNTLEGIRNVDMRLLEMARVMEIPGWNRFFYIYRPALKPYLDSAIRISVGMSWKSGVAAEVIGTPALSVGEQLYLSKIYLDTAGVLAWTAVTILASVLCERAVLVLWERFQSWEPRCRAAGVRFQRRRWAGEAGQSMQGSRVEQKPGSEYGEAAGQQSSGQGAKALRQEKETAGGKVVLRLDKVSKSYGGAPVLREVTASYEAGNIYYFRAPSGSGKTTLFRLIAGLEEPDRAKACGAETAGGIQRYGSRISMVFQEDRLCEAYSALINVDLVTGDREKSREHLLRLLVEADLDKPCRELSGGMRRRVAVARAMAAGGDIILLDEPYTGLDAESRSRTQRYIRSQGEDSALLIATHIGE